mmetsp:Transcript_22044/g.19605  ORF Transcript_22044/g.19605 Transcript_22044/m.19605 type:complete len:142 (+) Transcript_22044:93-518(+)
MNEEIPEKKQVLEGISVAIDDCMNSDIVKSITDTLTLKINDTVVNGTRKEAGKFHATSTNSIKESLVKNLKDMIENPQMSPVDLNSDPLLAEINLKMKPIFEKAEEQKENLLTKMEEHGDKLEEADRRIDEKIYNFMRKMG